MNDQKLVLSAVYYSARSMADGGWRVSFELGEWEREKIAELAGMRGEELVMVIMPAKLAKQDSTR